MIRGNARSLPLPDESVDLIVTSPPYFGLRSYRDAGEHYDGQIGSEGHPQEWLEALWACMAEWWRVLKPTGSCLINLGDKRAGSGGHNNSGISNWHTAPLEGGKPMLQRLGDDTRFHEQAKATRRNAPDRYNQAAFGRPKSRMALPERFVIGCMDGKADPEGIGWIYRQDLIWHKLNGLPESVTDRHRDNFEHILHFTKQERYFAAMDEIREPHGEWSIKRTAEHRAQAGRAMREGAPLEGTNQRPHTFALDQMCHALGKLPGAVWSMASEPLVIPQWAKEKFNLPDHFAAFPTELPRKLILAFSPSGICLECGQGRRPVVDRARVKPPAHGSRSTTGKVHGEGPNDHRATPERFDVEATIIGYACACTPYTDRPENRAGSYHDHEDRAGQGNTRIPTDRKSRVALPVREYHLDGWAPPPTRSAIVLDPFSGTGTVPGVARELGRIGIGVDLSADYCRLAKWRIEESGHFRKAMQRTYAERQGALFGAH